MPEPTPAPQPAPQPAPPPAPDPQPEPSPPDVDAEQVRAVVGAAVARAFTALRGRDFAAATRELDAVAEAALDDQQAADRRQHWNLLVQYAEQYSEVRDKALEGAVSNGSTYDIGPRKIAVVGIEQGMFIYRDSTNPGRNLRIPLDAIPADIEQIIVRSWFSNDDKPANHLILGAAALLNEQPDLEETRREFEIAADMGEPQGRMLLTIVDDPAVRGR